MTPTRLHASRQQTSTWICYYSSYVADILYIILYLSFYILYLFYACMHVCPYISPNIASTWKQRQSTSNLTSPIKIVKTKLIYLLSNLKYKTMEKVHKSEYLFHRFWVAPIFETILHPIDNSLYRNFGALACYTPQTYVGKIWIGDKDGWLIVVRDDYKVYTCGNVITEERQEAKN